MVMFLLSFVKGVQIRGGESKSASGYGPRGSKSAGTPGLLPLREKTEQREDFLYKRILLHSIDFPGGLDVHTFNCYVNFETFARELQQKVRNHAEKCSRVPRL